MASEFYLGLDLGQRMDFSALALVERTEVPVGRPAWKMEARYCLRLLERVKLGTPYPAIVGRVREVLRSPRVGRATLVVDGTGVGAPVVDLLQEARLGCEIVPVVITGGDRAHRDHGRWLVPKRDLVVGLQVMASQGELSIAAGLAEGRRLVEELMNLRVRVSEGGAKYGAWKEGVHDDMALALALACWRGRGSGFAGERGERLL